MKSKHEQLYVAVQDLLIGFGITPQRLRDIAANKTHSSISPKTAQKLIDADLIVEEINWRKSDNVSNSPPTHSCSLNHYDNGSYDKNSHEVALSLFNKIKADLAPGILWEYLREKHPRHLSDQIGKYLTPPRDNVKRPLSNNAILSAFDDIKPCLAPKILWEYLREKHSGFLSDQIGKHLAPPSDRLSEDTLFSTFNNIKSGLAPGILWSYLREEHPEFLFDQMKDYLFPSL